MNESLFENRAEALQKAVAKEIAYTYSVFIPEGTENITSKMKSNILLRDRKFLGVSVQNEIGNKLIFPYDVLKESIEKQINEFYSEFNFSSKTLDILSRYGGRADIFKKQFRYNLEKSKNTTFNVVQRELHLQILQGKDTKSVISHIQNVLSKRVSALNQLLKESAGQMRQYMVLWDYQDKGYTYYRLRTNGDNCGACTEMNGKVFRIDDAETGKSLMPFHPNCDCSAEILDENGKAVFVVGGDREDKNENDTDALNYLQTSLKQMILGNFADDTNLLGTLGQVALGLIGLDLPADIRDLVYDITHFKLTPEHAFQTIMDILALFPVVGGVKYTDEAGDALKLAAKHGDEAADAVKAADKSINFLEFPKKVHIGRQGKHIVGHNNYQQGRSILTISPYTAEELIKKYSGTGQKISNSSERVNFETIIGEFVDKETGKAYSTTIGTIRYSKDGAHIVPARPYNWRK